MKEPRATSGSLRGLLGLRRRFVVDGVKYEEVVREPLWRAMSRRGSGSKVYRVVFLGGRRMRITATPTRRFADLSGPTLTQTHAALEVLVRPGMRILLYPGGTGDAALWAAGRVGPAGAVVSLDPDAESARYARWRYPGANISHEHGGLETMRGELSGSFDAVIAVGPGDHACPMAAAAELWRLLAPGGWLAVSLAANEDGTPAVFPQRTEELPGGAVLARKPAEV